jgi:hypothetical protein
MPLTLGIRFANVDAFSALPSQIESMAKIKKQILMKKSLCGLFI